MSKTCVVQQQYHTEMAASTTTTTTTTAQQTSKINTIDHSNVLWPLLPKTGNSKPTIEQKQNASFPPNLLLRSSSLDRIRQFPAYLCRQGSNSALFWIYNSRSVFKEVLSATHEQLRGLFLTLCVYLAVGLIQVQLIVCAFVLSIAASSVSAGFIFMVICIALVGAIAFKTIPHDKEASLHTS